MEFFWSFFLANWQQILLVSSRNSWQPFTCYRQADRQEKVLIISTPQINVLWKCKGALYTKNKLFQEYTFSEST